MSAFDQQASPPLRPGILIWLKKNLFSSWFNTLLTFFSLTIIFIILKGLGSWILFDADWSPVIENLRLFAVGTYPAEQMWRIWIILYLLSILLGLSAGKFQGTVKSFGRALMIAYVILALFPIPFENLALTSRLILFANIAFFQVGFEAGKRLQIKNWWIGLGYIISFAITIVLLSGVKNSSFLPPVESSKWGGLLLTFLLAVVGIVASFPIGVLLALGRQSSLPVLKSLCILFIEVVRGVPLVTILFMTSILLPLFLPDSLRIDRVIRAMLGMTLFAAAYMAENVRGGLQSIPRGQYEAAKAIGLTNPQTTLLIILPQALRVVIPAIVGQFIALFMDTTLAVIVGLLELLAVGGAVLNSNPRWLLLDMEVYGFIAVIFWVFTYSMAYASRRVEEAVGLGRR